MCISKKYSNLTPWDFKENVFGDIAEVHISPKIFSLKPHRFNCITFYPILPPRSLGQHTELSLPMFNLLNSSVRQVGLTSPRSLRVAMAAWALIYRVLLA